MQVATHVRDAIVVQRPVVVAPRVLLLDQVATLEGAHQLHHLDARHGEGLAAQGTRPGTHAVLLARNHALRKEEAVYVVAGRLRNVSRHFCTAFMFQERESERSATTRSVIRREHKKVKRRRNAKKKKKS